MILHHPGPHASALRALATFRRTGRLRPGERRTIRLYRWRAADQTLAIPRGLLPAVRQLTPLTVRDERVRRPAPGWQFRGQLHDYQRQVVDAIVAQDGGIIVALPGAGKTAMAYAAAAIWDQPTLWLTHTLTLAAQARADATRWLGLPRAAIGFVGDERTDWQPLTIAMLQTLAGKPALVRRAARLFGTVIVDECHHLPANSFQRVAAALPAAHLLGMSATPEREDGLGPMLTALVGPRVAVPTWVLVSRDRVLLPTVLLVPTRFRGPAGANWAQLEKARAEDPERNRLLCEWIWRLWAGQRRVLVLVERTVHAQRLQRALAAAGVPARAIMGDTPASDRDRGFGEVVAGTAVGIATKIVNEGTNLPRVDALVLGAASRAQTRTIQQVGRVMRTAAGKTGAVVVDLIDDQAEGYRGQVAARVGHYRALGCRLQRYQGGTDHGHR